MTAQPKHTEAAAQMSKACADFLNSLSPAQGAKTVYEYMDGERIFWYYPPLNRHGLPLRDMDAEQRRLAYSVMASGLTQQSYQQAKLMIDHEGVLGPLDEEQGRVSFVRDPELYYFTIFSEPASDDPWGWRVEGHHLRLKASGATRWSQ